MSQICLKIDQAAANVGLESAAAAVISPVSVSADATALDHDIAQVESLVRSDSIELDSPEVRGYRELFAELGYSAQTPAGERLIQRVRDRGFPRYGNVVDAYNLVAVRYGCGIGVHDANELAPGDEIRVARAAGGERIRSLGQSRERPVTEGDVIYGLARMPNRPMAWLGKRDVDSAEWSVTASTTKLLVVVLGNRATSRDMNEQALRDVADLIKRSSISAVAEIVDACVA
jgi:DNA/RNA-binding domain of Phe-tRNA-synthetase-like protein